MSNAKTVAVFAAGATVGLAAGGYGVASVILRSKKMQNAYIEHLSDSILKWVYGEEPKPKRLATRKYGDVYKKRTYDWDTYKQPGWDNNYVFKTRNEALEVLVWLSDIASKYENANIADLNDLVGQKSTLSDSNLGWSTLRGVGLITCPGGYLIDFPSPKPV